MAVSVIGMNSRSPQVGFDKKTYFDEEWEDLS
jgi:hypothetical protein